MKTKLSLSILCTIFLLYSCQKENFIQTQEPEAYQSLKASIAQQNISTLREAGGADDGLFTNEICYTSATNPQQVSASQKWIINWDGTITIRTIFPVTFVDNTYGTNAIGWSRGHTFRDLVGSDHLQLALYDASNVKKMEFKLDYITASTTVPSGYKTLGVTGGEGSMILGSADDVVSVRTSIDENLNIHNYVLTTNSPATDNFYALNNEYPNWIYEVWYEVTVKPSAFGTTGFGIPAIAAIHASPSKTGNNTELVVATPCYPRGEIPGDGSGTVSNSVKSTISSDFCKVPIAAGSNIWFNASCKFSGKINTGTIIKIDNGSVIFSGIIIPLPSSIITFAASPEAPVYDAANNVWKITADLNQKGNSFFNGGIYVSPGLPGNIKPVNLSASFSANQPGIKIDWQWSAAVYNTTMNYTDLNVAGTDGKYKAGAPVAYKEFVIDGARRGMDNLTGSMTKTIQVTTK